jgi:hypothetical protein
MPARRRKTKKTSTISSKATFSGSIHTLLQRALQTAFVYLKHNVDLLYPVSSSSSTDASSRSSSELDAEMKYYADIIERKSGIRPDFDADDPEDKMPSPLSSLSSTEESDDSHLTDVDIRDVDIRDVDIRDGVIYELLHGCGPYLLSVLHGNENDDENSKLTQELQHHVEFASYMSTSGRSREYKKYVPEIVMLGTDNIDLTKIMQGESVEEILRSEEQTDFSDTDEADNSSIGSPIVTTEMCKCVVCKEWPTLRERFKTARKHNAMLHKLCTESMRLLRIKDMDPPPEPGFRTLTSSSDND